MMGTKKVVQVSAALIVLVAIATNTFQAAASNFFADKWSFFYYGIATLFLSIATIICIDIISQNPADSLGLRDLLEQYFWNLSVHAIGWWTVRNIVKCSHDIKKQQEDVLFEILNLNKSTAYSKDYGLDKIKTVEQFKKEIPFGTYERISPYIERLCDGEISALTNDPLDHMVFTSGTTGKNKFIPMTKHTPVTRFLGCKDYNVMIKRGRSMGRVVNIFHSYKSQKPVKKGQPSITNMSSYAFAYRGFWIQPKVVFNIVDEPPFLYATTLFSMTEREVVGIKTVFSPMLFSFFATMNQHWRQMCKEIEQGFIEKQSMDVKDEVLAEINSYLSPDPERAEELRNEFKKGMKNIARRIWPKVGYCDTAATGSLAPPAQLLSEMEMNGVPIISTFFAASEVMGGVNTSPDIDNIDYTLYPLAYFYEWVPEEHVSEENPETILTYQMEIGKNYEMVATSYTGLTRYRTWDILRVERKINKCPVFSFQYRFNQMLNLIGEKLNESVFVQVFLKYCKEIGLSLADFTATENYRLDRIKAYTDEFVEARHSLPQYVVFIEEKPDMPTVEMNEKLINKFDTDLGAAWELYGQFRKQSMVGVPQMFLVEQGTFQKVKLILIKETQTQQFKMPRSMTKEEALEFLVSKIRNHDINKRRNNTVVNELSH